MDPRGHINIGIAHAGPKAQYEGDTRNQIMFCRILMFIYRVLYTIHHIPHIVTIPYTILGSLCNVACWGLFRDLQGVRDFKERGTASSLTSKVSNIMAL